MYFSAAKSNYEETLSTVKDSAAVERERRKEDEEMSCDKAWSLYEKNKCDGADKNIKECEWLKKDIDAYCFKNHVKPLIALIVIALLRNFMF